MAPAFILLIFSGLYYAIYAEKVAERARREKWPVGGSARFLRVAGLSVAAFAAYLLYDGIVRSLESESTKLPQGWLWFWFIWGASIFLIGVWAIAKSRKWAEYIQSDQYGKTGFGTCLPLHSRRSIVAFGSYMLAWGAYWMWGGWPF